jgi:hypothetical protein
MATAEKRQGHPDRYPCIQCSEHFASAVGRATHMRTAHGIEEGFLCHECVSSCSEQERDVRHSNDHYRSRFSPAPMACAVLMCEYRSTSRELLDRHRRDDHICNGAHQPQCSECDYQNDSVVSVSVHTLHVHSKEPTAKRQQALKLKQESELEAKRAARIAKAEASAAVIAFSSTSGSSPAEGTADDTSSPAVQPASRKRRLSSSPPRMTAEQQREQDANAVNSNAFLEQQMAAYEAMTADERSMIQMRHRDRKNAKKAKAKEALAVKKARTS